MAVTYNPFVSKYGFKSEGFEVSPNGTLTATNIVSQDILANSIDAASIKLNGVPIFSNDDSTANKSLQIEGDLIVSEGSTPYLSVINGQIFINNRSDSIGTIDNVEIGSSVARPGTFTNIKTGDFGIPKINSSTNLALSAANAIIFQIDGANKGRIDEFGASVPLVNTTVNNTTIGSTTPSSGAFTTLTLTTQTELGSSATRKDYVDTQISAFAIAFGI